MHVYISSSCATAIKSNSTMVQSIISIHCWVFMLVSHIKKGGVSKMLILEELTPKRSWEVASEEANNQD